MKVIIAGSRSYGTVEDYMRLENFLIFLQDYEELEITEVVNGMARGPDQFGAWFAKTHNIPVVNFEPDWRQYGTGAGYIRNKEMAEYADVLVAMWDGKSKGTRHMINIANELDLIVYTLGNK